MTKWVYSFGSKKNEGSADMKNLLGGKGANLAEMCLIGVPVPPGFTITTEMCNEYYSNNKKITEELKNQVSVAIKDIEDYLGKKFGDSGNPLLVSVRSGARASMPGMMDTVLNLGINDKVTEGLAKKTGNERFAYDSYRRFIQMYGNVVMNVEHHLFDHEIENLKSEKGVYLDTELDANDLKRLVTSYKQIVLAHTGKNFPENPEEQLWGAICAVFDSWMNNRAITYRKMHGFPSEWGTAVNVQSMVFGNMGETCATGVAFTRNPSTGENALYGEYLINAQGEDVVAGIRTPQSITIKAKEEQASKLPAMEESMPKIYKDLCDIYHKLEAHYRDMQDIEFTVENNKLWILQTRNGKRTAKAAIKIAVDLVKQGLITKEEALEKIDPASLDQLLHPTIDDKAKKQVIAVGLPASPGAACGAVVFSADDAEREAGLKKKVILVRAETSPEDIKGMYAAAGILTSKGGMTSHAAVVARGMGKTCISGAGDIKIDYKAKQFTVKNIVVKEGDIITINGSNGEVILGEVAMIKPNLSGDFSEIMAWADSVRVMKVRANAETPLDSKAAREFGAEGIGLCRTEHMFFDPERINVVREMILSDDLEGRKHALDKLLPMQRKDFVDIFRIMEGLPVTVRLLDPPLHEFLPHTDEDIKNVAKESGLSEYKISKRSEELHESNPMLGHRGCRLAITYPEIYEMQARALFEALAEVKKSDKKDVKLEIMIPLVMGKKELATLKQLIINVEKEVAKESGLSFDYMIGTMIELPRAAIRAGEIAEEAQFFSFGTNDLTQTTLGLSRDDSGSFLTEYEDKNIIPHDPFARIDRDGVGELIKMAIERGKKTRPDVKLGVCGEHGGDPYSIEFFGEVGLDYVSCSPYRIPIARLAAARSAIKLKKQKKEGEGLKRVS